MSTLRKGRSYNIPKERPYTRKSKYRNKMFVRSTPVCKVTRFDSGAKEETLSRRVVLVASNTIQMRHNCLESARMTVQRLMDLEVPKDDYHFKIKAYPHHHLRENPLASGAGADRMSTGMQKAFGKVIGLAAQVKKGQEVFEIKTRDAHIDKIKNALRKANCKLPGNCKIVVY